MVEELEEWCQLGNIFHKNCDCSGDFLVVELGVLLLSWKLLSYATETFIGWKMNVSLKQIITFYIKRLE